MQVESSSGGLNAIAPYFTMFPLDYPLEAIRRYSHPGDLVLDPFCGRGTTNYAARLLGRRTHGIDCNPVAVAIARAKLVDPDPQDVVEEARSILETEKDHTLPAGLFWSFAYDHEVLCEIVKLRKALLDSCRSSTRIALSAIILGALHGPINKGLPSYFSNQCPRTYAPKPDYSVRFWRDRELIAPRVDVLRIIQDRAERYYGERTSKVPYTIFEGDSRYSAPYARILNRDRVNLIVTSPPYPGMTTYYTDQWLRNWFLGGPDHVNYGNNRGIRSLRMEEFVNHLREVWEQAATHSTDTALLVCRFGVLPSFKGSKRAIIVDSFRQTQWKVDVIRSAGVARKGKRIADTMGDISSAPKEEIDVICSKGRVRISA